MHAGWRIHFLPPGALEWHADLPAGEHGGGGLGLGLVRGDGAGAVPNVWWALELHASQCGHERPLALACTSASAALLTPSPSLPPNHSPPPSLLQERREREGIDIDSRLLCFAYGCSTGMAAGHWGDGSSSAGGGARTVLQQEGGEGAQRPVLKSHRLLDSLTSLSGDFGVNVDSSLNAGSIRNPPAPFGSPVMLPVQPRMGLHAQHEPSSSEEVEEAPGAASASPTGRTVHAVPLLDRARWGGGSVGWFWGMLGDRTYLGGVVTGAALVLAASYMRRG
jgi:hypothetical protein